MKLSRNLFVVGLLLGTSPALAEAPGFAALDKNGDGFLSPQEWSASRGDSASGGATRPLTSTLFQRLDTDGNGLLSQAELWSERGERGNWVAFDRDRDGAIAPREFTALRAQPSR